MHPLTVLWMLLDVLLMFSFLASAAILLRRKRGAIALSIAQFPLRVLFFRFTIGAVGIGSLLPRTQEWQVSWFVACLVLEVARIVATAWALRPAVASRIESRALA